MKPTAHLPADPPESSPADLGSAQATLQRRSLALLCAAQVLGGLSMGASLSLGAILGEELSGTESLAGVPTTVVTLGAAAAGLPLASLASRRGRRPALSGGLFLAALGSAVVALAVDRGWFWLLLVGMVGIGAGSAVALQSRFAATDLSAPASRGRDLSLVVWMTMVGAIAGPALVSAGASLARWMGVADLAGPFLLGSAGALLAAIVLWSGLRPDPLLTARRIASATTRGEGTWASGESEAPGLDVAGTDAAGTGVGSGKPVRGEAFAAIRSHVGARNALVAVLSAHAVMVAVMALTPVHLSHGGASLQIVGFSISAHLAGMYMLAPLMGVLADRLGRVPMIVVGQGILLTACAVGVAAAGSHSGAGLVVALVLLGIGWSAATVAASTLLTESIDEAIAPRVQGISDSSMSLAGAAAGVLAGVVVGAFGYQVLVGASGAVAVGTVIYLAVDRQR